MTLAQQDFPSRPLRMVIPFETGGSTDIQARIIAAEMTRNLGQTVIAENRTGAGGFIGADVVAKSRPDGYTLCFCTTTQTILAPLANPKPPYDAARDLQPVTQLYIADGTITVRPGLGVNTFAQLVARAKANPGKLNYGSNGLGSTTHLGTIMLTGATGIDMVHVPYKGEQPALNDLLGDRLDVLFLSVTLASRLAKTGQLKILAVRGLTRNALLPDVPTIAELGFPGAESTTHGGLFVAAGTPPAIVEKLYETTSRAVNAPDIKARIAQEGQVTVGNRPEVYAAWLQSERERWAKVARTLGPRE